MTVHQSVVQQQQEDQLSGKPRKNETTRPVPITKTWVLPSQCESLCHNTVDPRTGRYPTRVSPRGPYLLSNSAYGELADIDYNNWPVTQPLMNVSQASFWNKCFPPIVIIYLYTMRDIPSCLDI